MVWLFWELGGRMLSAVDAIGPGLFIALELVVFGVVVFALIGGAVAFVRWLNLRSRAVHHDAGLFPIMYHGGGYVNVNEPQAQHLAVMHAAGRATSASVGKVLDWQPEPVQLPSVPAMLTPGDVSSVDLRENPHFLLIGGTGSGKTTASYKLLGDLVRRNPTEVVITEPGGVNWSSQATATDTPSIARAIGDVHSELVRRQDLLRAADCDHVRDLPEPLPFVILVVEEAEATLDDLRLTDRATRDATVIALRNLARMGRKCGISLVVCTQSGTADLLDTHMRRNFGTVLLFRSEHTIPEMWRLKGVKLSDLPPGAAYSVRHGAMVSFPMTARPVLPMLSAPSGMTGGIAVPDWPSHTGIPLESVPVPAESGSTGSIPVFHTDDRTAYSSAQIAHIQALYGRLGSIKAVERNLYGQDGGYWFYRLKDVLS